MAVETLGFGWAEAYIENRMPMDTFLQSFFRFGPRNIHNAPRIKFDIKRNGRTIAIPIREYEGGNMNKMTEFKGMEIKPPGYSEGFVITGEMLQDRMPGQLPHEVDDVTYAAAVTEIMMDHFDMCDQKIVGGLELQASQILQTGKLAIVDADSASVYEFDFLPETDHFATVSTTWEDAAADPLGDLETQIRLTSRDGKCKPDMCILGTAAKNALFNHAATLAKLNILRLNEGQLQPRTRDSRGAGYLGTYILAGFEVALWEYGGYYELTPGGTQANFIDTKKVVILASDALLVRESCNIPFVAPRDPRVTALIPARVTSTENGVDLTPNAWIAKDSKSVTASLEARTVLIPKQIDAFSCLTVLS